MGHPLLNGVKIALLKRFVQMSLLPLWRLGPDVSICVGVIMARCLPPASFLMASCCSGGSGESFKLT